MLAMGLDSGVKNPRELSIPHEFIKEAQMHHHEYEYQGVCKSNLINQEATSANAWTYSTLYDGLLAN